MNRNTAERRRMAGGLPGRRAAGDAGDRGERKQHRRAVCEEERPELHDQLLQGQRGGREQAERGAVGCEQRDASAETTRLKPGHS